MFTMTARARRVAAACAAAATTCALTTTPPAHAAVTCTFSAGTIAIDVTGTAPNVAAVIRNGSAIEVRSTSGTGSLVACGAPTVTTTDTITVTDTSPTGSTGFTVDLTGGEFAPGITAEADGSEIEMHATLGAGAAAPFGDFVRVVASPAAARSISGGVNGALEGLNLDTTETTDDVDVDMDTGTSPSGTETVQLIVNAPTGAGAQTMDFSGLAPFTAALSRATFVTTSDGNDVFTGGTGGDAINVGAGTNTVNGGDGADRISTGSGNDTVNGGANSVGSDTLQFDTSGAAVTFDVGIVTAQATGQGSDTVSGIENVQGTNGDDVLTGDGQNNTITGLTGQDTLTGKDGNDTITGDSGATQANDLIEGGAGDDILRAGDFSVDGASGDSVSYAGAGAGVTVDLAVSGSQPTGGAGADQLIDADTSGIPDFENAFGSGADDDLSGSAAANTLTGALGNDTLEGRGGNDILNGSGLANDTGNDTARYADAPSAVTVTLANTAQQDTVGAGLDTLPDAGDAGSESDIENLIGSDSGDTLSGDDRANVLTGGDANDALEGAGGDDTLHGGAGSGDVASYAGAPAGVAVSLATAASQDTGGAGSDTLDGIERLIGSGSGDALTGDAGANALAGGAGNDQLTGAGGDDTLRGGDNTDTVRYDAAPDGVTLSLAGTGAQITGGAGTDTLPDGDIENVLGSAHDDVLGGSGGANDLAGGDGADLLDGAAGDDTLHGGGGTDTATYAGAPGAVSVSLGATGAQATGGAGADTLPDADIENLVGSTAGDTLTGAPGANALTGGSGDDTLQGAGGDDALLGGNGEDTASYAAAPAGVTVSLGSAAAQDTGAAGTDTLGEVEHLIGGAFADTLTGSAGANALRGGDGDDTVSGGAGDDTLRGGAGNDTASYASAPGAVTVSLALATAQATGGAGSDTLPDGDVEGLLGSPAGDELTGSTQANAIDGGAGADAIAGANGDDTLTGGAGADALDGGAGNDAIQARDGEVDTVTCGVGTDSVVADANDSVAADCETVGKPGTGTGTTTTPATTTTTTTTTPGGGAAPDTVAPKLALRVRGTALTLTLDEAATVTFTVQRLDKGRKGKGGRCEKPAAKNRRGKACKRPVTVGTFRVTAPKGTSGAKRPAKIARKALRAGSYQLVAVARDAAGNASQPIRAAFSVKAAKKRS